MFKKPKDVQVSNKTQLKNKDTRTLKQDVIRNFPTAAPSDDDEEAGLFPAAKSVIVCAKTAGSRMLMYGEKDMPPLVIDLDGRRRFMPTLEALWRIPTLLPRIYVHSPVSEFIMGGADLMLPGVVPIGSMLPNLPKGAIVSLVVIGNPLPFAVGELLAGVEDWVGRMKMRGKGIRILHHFRDELWDFCGRKYPNEGFDSGSRRVLPLENPREALQRMNEEAIAEKMAALAVSEDIMPNPDVGDGIAGGGGGGGDEDEEGGSDDGSNDGSDEEGSEEESEDDSEEEEGVDPYDHSHFPEPWNEATHDELVEATFLQALRKHLRKKRLPMLANVFFSNVLTRCRPEGTRISIKRTKYKKLSVMLKHYTDMGLIQMSEKSKGVWQIDDIDRHHELYRRHKKWDSDDEAEEVTDVQGAVSTGGAGGGASAEAVEEAAAKEHGQAGVQVLYQPNTMVLPVVEVAMAGLGKELPENFSALSDEQRMEWGTGWTIGDQAPVLLSDKRKRTGSRRLRDDNQRVRLEEMVFTQKEAVHLVARYIAIEKLVNESNKTQVSLDRLLTDALFKGQNKNGREYPRQLTRAEVARTWVMRFNLLSLVTRVTGEKVAMKGNAPSIRIVSKAVQGRRKHITFVSRLENFGLVPAELARESQRLFASSASTVEGEKPGTEEVQMQGDVAHKISDYLTGTLNIPPQYVSVFAKSGTAKADKERKGHGKTKARFADRDKRSGGAMQ